MLATLPFPLLPFVPLLSSRKGNSGVLRSGAARTSLHQMPVATIKP